MSAQSAAALFDRALAMQKAGANREAIDLYDRVIALNDPKENEGAHFNRGFAKKDLGDHAGAIADFREVLRLNPKAEAAYYWRAWQKL